MIKKLLLLSAFFIFLSGCATGRAVIKPDYNFSAVKTVKVGVFAADMQYENSGSAVQNAFMRQLLSKGYRVVADSSAYADVTIEGSVTTFQPDKRYLIRNANTHSNRGSRRGRRDQTVIYTGNDIVEISGSNMYDLGTAFGMGEDNRIMASNATVGIYAYMIDSETGEVVWSDSYTYEGLDLSSALDGAVKYILRTLPRESQVK